MLFTWTLVTLRSTRPLTGTNVLVNVAPLAGCSMARIGGLVIPGAGACDWMVGLTPVVVPAAARDRPVRLERARLRRLRRTPALVVVQHHELVRLEVEVLRVIAQEAARVHRSRERLVIAVLERLQELLAYPRVARGLLERDAFALALCAELLAEPAHPRSGGLCPRRSSS